MLYTIPAWATYPAWQRLRPVYLTNNGSAATNAIVRIVVPYDGTMQSDFDDLRFTTSTGVPLLYNRIIKTDGDSATVLIKIPSLPHGMTQIYMFYANPTATDGSSMLLTWTKVTVDDVRISYVGATEGCWGPAVAHGVNQFLVTWAEGLPPETSSDESHRLIHREIHGRLYNGQGGNPIPVPGVGGDIVISPTTAVHAENPSVAYSPLTSRYLVAWEENPTLARYAIGIHATVVRASDHFVYTPVTVDDPIFSGGSYWPCRNPCVAFDNLSDRFLIVWSKCDASSNIDVYGRLLDSYGGWIGGAFAIASGVGYQGQPFVASDNDGHFQVSFENGTSGTNGPLSVRSILLNSNGAPVSAFYTLETGSTYTDCIYPSSAYNPAKQQYLTAWNTGDISGLNYAGRIDAFRLSYYGIPQASMLTVKSSTIAKRTSVVPYFTPDYLVSYDYLAKVYGRVVTDDGIPIETELQLCDSLAAGADNAVLAVNGSNVFAIWEDERNHYYTEVYGSVWHVDQTMVTTQMSFGAEAPLLLDATLTSVPITPENFVHWKHFGDRSTLNNCTINFRLLNQSGTLVLKSWMNNGEDISLITQPIVRVQALFHRTQPVTSPAVDYWNVTALVGGDLEAPHTWANVSPAVPNGENGWYTTPIQVTLQSFDNDSPPQNVSTYYRLNGGAVQNYTGPFNVSEEQANNSVEYWSRDLAGNEELPHKLLSGLNIDGTMPFVTITSPSMVIFLGEAQIAGVSVEETSGSGIDLVSVLINDEEVYSQSFNQTRWANVSWNFTALTGDSYDIKIRAFDHAGNIGTDRRLVSASEYGLYLPGYLYLFDSPKIGPLYQLQKLMMAVVINYDILHVVLHSFPADAVSAEFTATRQLLAGNYSFYDMNLSDGASYDMPLPVGVYQISVTLYDVQGSPVNQEVLIYKVFVLLLKTA